MDLFRVISDKDKQHYIFKMMLHEMYEPERAVLLEWADGFHDRDGKFIYEFQTTFESSLWELYIHAFLKELGAYIDFSYHAPDFVVNINGGLTIEATIAAPAMGGEVAFGHTKRSAPSDFNEFNRKAAIRILNSISGKYRKFHDSYSKQSHVKDKPYVIALASFDQPFSHFSVNRPIMMALYGIYFDEEATIQIAADEVIKYPVEYVQKKENVNIKVGLFSNDEYSDVSAIIYSSLATWGKVRALAENPDAMTVYNTFHPNSDSIVPIIKTASKRNYSESLADGLHIFHNPYATHPLDVGAFNHERIAQYFVGPDGELIVTAPDDFLLLRQLISVRRKSNA